MGIFSAILNFTFVFLCAEPPAKKVSLDDLKVDPPKSTYDPSLETSETTVKTLEATFTEGEVRGLGISMNDKGEVKPVPVPLQLPDNHLRMRQRSDAVSLPGGIVTEGELRSDFAESMVQQHMRR